MSSFLNPQLDEQKKKVEIKKALSRRDWSIVDSQFAMALCCLNESYDEFGDLFDAVKDKDFDVNAFMGFAIFTRARDQPIFKEKMLEHYGIEIDTSESEPEEAMRKED